jgi:hypothetical protein
MQQSTPMTDVSAAQPVTPPARVTQAALNVLTAIAKNYPPTTEYQVLTTDRISPALQGNVAQSIRELEQAGFHLVCIYENVTFGNSNGKFVPQWYSTAAAGAPIGVTVFHLPPSPYCSVACETHLSDGRVIRSNNAAMTKHTPRPPQIEAHILPADTSVAKILAVHGRALSNCLDADNNLVFRVPLTSDELFAENCRQARLVHDFRRQIGFVTEDELVALAKQNTQFAHQVYAEIRRLVTAGYDPFAARGRDSQWITQADASLPRA